MKEHCKTRMLMNEEKWETEMGRSEVRRGRPSNDCEERDKMELSSSDVKGRNEDGKEKREDGKGG